jgi:hypothetical protein
VIKGVGGNEEDYELCAVMGKVSGEKGIWRWGGSGEKLSGKNKWDVKSGLGGCMRLRGHPFQWAVHEEPVGPKEACWCQSAEFFRARRESFRRQLNLSRRPLDWWWSAVVGWWRILRMEQRQDQREDVNWGAEGGADKGPEGGCELRTAVGGDNSGQAKTENPGGEKGGDAVGGSSRGKWNDFRSE